MPLKWTPKTEVATVSPDERLMREQVDTLLEKNAILQESLQQVAAMFAREDRGWKDVFAANDADEGMTLEELRKWSKEIKNAAVGNPHIRKGLSFRTSATWQDGIQYREGTIPTESRGRGKNVQSLIDKAVNQRNFFSPAARARREESLYSGGLAVYLGDDATKELRALPLAQITADYRDPDHSEDVWAYRRTWRHYTPGSSVYEEKSEWYFTDTFWDKKAGHIVLSDGSKEPVSQTTRAFDLVANSVDGFAYGSPDALAALVWSRIVKDLYIDGTTMQAALATFAFKASVNKPGGATGVGLKMGGSAPAGSTAVTGATNDLVPLSTAGKGYDFSSFNPVIALVASALDISASVLTAEGNDAAALDLVTRLAVERRRTEHVAFDRRVLAWLGAPDADVYFIKLDASDELYRQEQALVLRWNTGLYGAEEIKQRFELLDGKTTITAPPKDVLVPNSKAAAAAAAPPAPQTPSTAAPDQGTSNGTGGKGNSGNDIRTDKKAK